MEKLSSRAARILKPLISTAEGFAGHRTTAPINTLLKEGLKPASELAHNKGLIAREPVNTPLSDILVKSYLEEGRYHKDMDLLGTKVRKLVEEIKVAKPLKTKEDLLEAYQLEGHKEDRSEFTKRVLASNPEDLKQIRSSITEPIMDFKVPLSLVPKNENVSLGDAIRKLKQAKTPKEYENLLRTYNYEPIGSSKHQGLKWVKMQDALANLYNKKFNTHTEYEARELLDSSSEPLFDSFSHGNRTIRPGGNDYYKLLSAHNARQYEFDSARQTPKQFLAQKAYAFKKYINSYEGQLSKDSLRAIFAQKSPEVVKEKLLKDPFFKSKFSSEIDFDNPNKVGAPSVFFLENTILKPSENIGRYGIITPIKALKSKSSKYIDTEKSFIRDAKTSNSALRPLHEKPLQLAPKLMGREIGARPATQSTNGVAFNVKTPDTVIIVPKKDWPRFSKEHPEVHNKIREDKAEKILHKFNQPMISIGWAK